MKKVHLYICMFALLLLTGCEHIEDSKDIKETSLPKTEASTPTASAESKLSAQEINNIGSYLFNAEDVDSIEISEAELFARKAVDMAVKMAGKQKMYFEIEREDYGLAIEVNVADDSMVIDYSCEIDGVDDMCCALPDFYYQIACYDFNKDGKKEIIIAAGNKKDKLYIYVYELDYNKKINLTKSSPILISHIEDGCKAYVNSENEICVIDDKNEVTVHHYDELKQIEESKLSTEEYKNKKICIKYPQITEVDSILSEKLNQKIKKDAMRVLDKYSDKLDEVEADIDYQYTLDKDRDFLSIRYEGKMNVEKESGSQFYTSNIDLTDGSRYEFTWDYNFILDFAKEIKKKAVYVASADKIDDKAKNQVAKEWEKYDAFLLYADLDNASKNDKFSYYFTENTFGISFEVEKDLGSHAEYEISYKDLKGYFMQ